jgi:myo-inositol-1(or 4)-monophosphatase
MPLEFSNEAKWARCAALEAGRLLKDMRAQWNTVTDNARRDIKLRADREAETIILDLLRRHTPHPILSEEAGAVGESFTSDALHWIVDPLDGTANYSRGVPLAVVSIALWNGQVPVYGVIYDFWRNEIFQGGRDAGAFLNEYPIHVSAETDPAQAILATGFPANRDFGAEPLQRFLTSIQSFRKIRLFGSAALSLAYVACGRVDAYSEEDIMLWDIAAGAAIVEGAGGHVAIEHSPGAKRACRTRAAACAALLPQQIVAPRLLHQCLGHSAT